MSGDTYKEIPYLFLGWGKGVFIKMGLYAEGRGLYNVTGGGGEGGLEPE